MEQFIPDTTAPDGERRTAALIALRPLIVKGYAEGTAFRAAAVRDGKLPEKYLRGRKAAEDYDPYPVLDRLGMFSTAAIETLASILSAPEAPRCRLHENLRHPARFIEFGGEWDDGTFLDIATLRRAGIPLTREALSSMRETYSATGVTPGTLHLIGNTAERKTFEVLLLAAHQSRIHALSKRALRTEFSSGPHGEDTERSESEANDAVHLSAEWIEYLRANPVQVTRLKEAMDRLNSALPGITVDRFLDYTGTHNALRDGLL